MAAYQTNQSDILIIGGGAAGLLAACACGRTAREANKSITITLLEKNSRVGRKLLSTGNGRCNLSNSDLDVHHYHSSSLDIVKTILAKQPAAYVPSFFRQLGLHITVENGRLYPYSQTASSVLDSLRFETEHLGIRTYISTHVSSIEYLSKNGSFLIKNTDNTLFHTQKLIIATGGKAAPATGSDGDGLRLLSELGHTVNPVFPVLTPLIARHKLIKSLKGIRIKPSVLTVSSHNQVLASEPGELLFTEYGLSGIPALQVSGAVYGHTDVIAEIDLLPAFEISYLKDFLLQRRLILGHWPIEHFFMGLLHKQVGHAILNDTCGNNLSQPVFCLTDNQLHMLARTLKAWYFPITSVKGFTHAQATGGGADLNEFDPDSMQSRRKLGLYAAGEVLDVYGDCGGYNLHWAWITGSLAGTHACMSVMGAR